jgi:hypothetical protein
VSRPRQGRRDVGDLWENAADELASRTSVPGLIERLADVLASHEVYRDRYAAQTATTDQGYVGVEYLIRFSPSLQEPSYLVGPTTLFANVHIAVDARLVGARKPAWSA